MTSRDFDLISAEPTLSFDEVLPELLDRYFRAYGPATLADAAYFFGISKEDAKRLESLSFDDLCRLDYSGKTYYYSESNDMDEEALCFGWIDGQMQSIDDKSYIKYFSMRRKNSKWSEKNKALAETLEKQGVMTDYGRAKIEEAKKNGQWDVPKPPEITEEQIASLSDLLKEHEPAYTNFIAMPVSVKKTYTRAYFDAKTDAGRNNRLSWMVERLNKNLKPM